MQLKPDFDTFLASIRPTPSQRDELKRGHQLLRSRLDHDTDLAPILVTSFLQGSYRRYTAIRPKGDKRSDVDIIVVTNLDEKDTPPRDAQARFEPFLKRHYSGKWRRQGRSLGIEMSNIDLDLVITSAPSAAERAALRALAESSEGLIDEDDPSWGFSAIVETSSARWKDEPLRIPDRDADQWQDTNPLAQLDWTRQKNRRTHGNSINVVKAVKWWRLQADGEALHPKGFLLERIVAECCPDNIHSVAEGFTFTLENVVNMFTRHRSRGTVPFLGDYGLPSMNVLARLTFDDFRRFYDAAQEAAPRARAALECLDADDSRRRWRDLLGPKFPAPVEHVRSVPSFDVPHRQAPPWAISVVHPVNLIGRWRRSRVDDWKTVRSEESLPSGVELRFTADVSLDQSYWAVWQVANTGDAAGAAGDLRGDFYRSTTAGVGGCRRDERTRYPGVHWIECFITDGHDQLFGRSGPFIVRVG